MKVRRGATGSALVGVDRLARRGVVGLGEGTPTWVRGGAGAAGDGLGLGPGLGARASGAAMKACTVSAAMPKPSPWLSLSRPATIPITLPRRFTIGPPELPGF